MEGKSLVSKLDKWLFVTKFGKWVIKRNQLWLENVERSYEEMEKREGNEKEYLLWEYHKEILALDKFSGSMGDYKFLKPGNYQIIDTGIPEKRVFVRDYVSINGSGSSRRESIREFGLKYKSLFEQGLCGFVRWDGWYGSDPNSLNGIIRTYNWGEGIPIRKMVIQNKTNVEKI